MTTASVDARQAERHGDGDATAGARIDATAWSPGARCQCGPRWRNGLTRWCPSPVGAADRPGLRRDASGSPSSWCSREGSTGTRWTTATPRSPASLQRGLDDLIANFPAGRRACPEDLVDALVKGVHDAVHGAVKDTLEPLRGDRRARCSTSRQSGTPSPTSARTTCPPPTSTRPIFDPSSHSGPALIDLPADVIRSVRRRRRPGRSCSTARSAAPGARGRGRARAVARPARAVAGYATPEGYQHAIAAAARRIEVTES